ncbi:NUDIX domain-containing protein [Flavobacterium sp.]|uniref:NUDIX domain-containing protein n=1 Tax=Flavobacterium sp. TaxID=239 RepID=UPI0039E68E76
MGQSAGILLYKKTPELMVLLAHPGGPFWKNKDRESWSIPKGEFTDDEDPLDAAIREFEEETGTRPDGHFIALQSVTLQSGKTVMAWALEGDLNAETLVSNTFEIEWPPQSGIRQSFLEIDKAEWFSVETALQKINPAQQSFILELVSKLN